jgi:hypothetical protein
MYLFLFNGKIFSQRISFEQTEKIDKQKIERQHNELLHGIKNVSLN